MKLRSLIIFGIAGAFVLCSCTERRRAGDVVADGDTVRVVIPDKTDSTGHADEDAPGNPDKADNNNH